MTDQDLDQPLDEYKTVPTWDYPSSSAYSGDEGDPSCPRVIIELWSSPPPRPVRLINDVEVASVDEQPTDADPDQSADDQLDQGAQPELGELDDPDKTLDLPPDAPDHPGNWQAPTPTRDASKRGPYAKTTSPLTRPSSSSLGAVVLPNFQFLGSEQDSKPNSSASDEPARDPDAVESKQQLSLDGKLEINFTLIIYIIINIIRNYFSFFSWRGGRF